MYDVEWPCPTQSGGAMENRSDPMRDIRWIAPIDSGSCPAAQEKANVDAKKKSTKPRKNNPKQPPPSTTDDPKPKEKKTSSTVAERIAGLKADRWVCSFTRGTVVCGGCKRTIKTDSRSNYYPGLWNKHVGRCRKIQRILAEVRIDFTCKNVNDAGNLSVPRRERERTHGNGGSTVATTGNRFRRTRGILIASPPRKS
ncbi:hypothetical protein C8R43DRAFT_1041989 [Mycena crocata]|nr:hypothetical protein C8R43DRAFT_1041989 [Mycena crocata]